MHRILNFFRNPRFLQVLGGVIAFGRASFLVTCLKLWSKAFGERKDEMKNKGGGKNE